MHTILTMTPVLLTVLLSAAPAMGRTEVINVRLREQAETEQAVFLIGDIADVYGGTVSEQRAVREMDIGEFRSGEPLTTEVSAARVGIRLMLAGYSRNQFVVSGAEAVAVSRKPHELLTDRKIETLIRQAVLKRLQLQPDEIRIQLSQPVADRLPSDLRDAVDAECEVTLPTEIRPGSLLTALRFWSRGNLLQTVNARCEFLRKQSVPVLQTGLERGARLSRSAIRMESRFLDHAVRPVSFEEIEDRSLRSARPAGTVLSDRDLAPHRPSQQRSDPVIRRRDSVRLFAKIGAIQVEIRAAEAMEDGRIGETIRFLNPSSGVTVRAVIRDHRTAEVIAGSVAREVVPRPEWSGRR